MLSNRVGRWVRLLFKAPKPELPGAEQAAPDAAPATKPAPRPAARSKRRPTRPRAPDAPGRRMLAILAVRDNETGEVLELRELVEHERQNAAPIYAAMRKKYPPPRYDLVIGMAASMDDFLRSYPRFRRRGKMSGGGGTDGRTDNRQTESPGKRGVF